MSSKLNVTASEGERAKKKVKNNKWSLASLASTKKLHQLRGPEIIVMVNDKQSSPTNFSRFSLLGLSLLVSLFSDCPFAPFA